LQKMREMKYSLLFILIPLAMVLVILTLHTMTNVREIAIPPNEEWSNPVDIAFLDAGKQPYLKYQDGRVQLYYLSKEGLQEITLDNEKIASEQIIIADNPDFINNDQYQIIDDLVLWSKYQTLHVDYLANDRLVPVGSFPKVSGYDWIKTGNSTYLLVSSEEGLSLYQYQNQQFSLISNQEDFPPSMWIKGDVSAERIDIYALTIPHYNRVAYYSSAYLLDGSWQDVRIIDEQLRIESMFDISDVSFVVHNDQVTVYSITKTRLQTEVFRQIERLVFSKSTGEIQVEQSKIPNPVLFGRNTQNTEFLTHLSSDNGVDTFVVTAHSGTGREEGNIKVVKLNIEDGAVIDYQFLTKGAPFSKFPSYLSTDSGDYLAWLETIKSGYQLRINSQNESFRTAANSIYENQWSLAFGYTFQDSWITVLSFFKGLIWLLPPLLLLVIFSIFLKPEWLDENAKIAIVITIAMFAGYQLIEMDYFYRPRIVPYMPWWLTFSGAKYVIPLMLNSLLLIPTWAFTKKMELPSPFLTFFYFVATQLVIINLLYAPYMIF